MRASLIISVLGSLLGAAALSQTSCGGDDDHGDEDPIDCATETRADNIVSGLEKTGSRGALTFRLMSTSPAPPKRPDNNWLVHIESGGAPVDGATIGVRLYMPDHEHGTGVKPMISAAGTPGDYKLDQLNLWMPGLWEVTVEATPAGGAKDSAVFRVCIPE
jgi:YtkA-like